MLHSKSEPFRFDKALKRQNGNVFQRYLNIDKYFFHPLASRLTRLVFPTRITPNQLTYFSFFLGLAAALAFAAGTRFSFVCGGVLCLLSAIVDNADGMLARSREQCSEFGSHLDLMLDRINDVVMISSIGVGAFLYLKHFFFLILGLATSAMYGLQIIIFYLTKSFLKISSRGETGIARDFAAFLLCICALFGKMDIALYLLAGQSVLSVVIRTGYFISLKNHIR
jgi:phosphatidylglycerophosphate synthase